LALGQSEAGRELRRIGRSGDREIEKQNQQRTWPRTHGKPGQITRMTELTRIRQKAGFLKLQIENLLLRPLHCYPWNSSRLTIVFLQQFRGFSSELIRVHSFIRVISGQPFAFLRASVSPW
jgi:hypothetical protein